MIFFIEKRRSLFKKNTLGIKFLFNILRFVFFDLLSRYRCGQNEFLHFAFGLGRRDFWKKRKKVYRYKKVTTHYTFIDNMVANLNT